MSSVEHVTVEVPGSSANLGPGFDALAAALDVVLTVTTTDRVQQRVVLGGLGEDELPSDDGNLIWRAFVAYCDRYGVDVPDVSLRTTNEIPLERGMGSSAAAAVAGVVLGRALLGAGGSNAELLQMAADMEGHPDNAAAALLGGLVLCAEGFTKRFDPAPTLRPVICIPHTRLATSAARDILPEHITLAEAAANGARTAMVLAGLAGHVAWEPAVMRDVLHEPARFGVMSPSGELVTALRVEGVAACLSGAGPSVLSVVRCGDDRTVALIQEIAGEAWDVRAVQWHRRGASKVSNTTTAAG